MRRRSSARHAEAKKGPRAKPQVISRISPFGECLDFADFPLSLLLVFSIPWAPPLRTSCYFANFPFESDVPSGSLA